MIAFVLALAVVGVITVIGLNFLIWTGAQWRDARKYRFIMQHIKDNPAMVGDHWRITYKEGRKQASIVAPGKTDAEALQWFMQNGKTRFDSIVSMDKV